MINKRKYKNQIFYIGAIYYFCYFAFILYDLLSIPSSSQHINGIFIFKYKLDTLQAGLVVIYILVKAKQGQSSNVDKYIVKKN